MVVQYGLFFKGPMTLSDAVFFLVVIYYILKKEVWAGHIERLIPKTYVRAVKRRDILILESIFFDKKKKKD